MRTGQRCAAKANNKPARISSRGAGANCPVGPGSTVRFRFRCTPRHLRPAIDAPRDRASRNSAPPLSPRSSLALEWSLLGNRLGAPGAPGSAGPVMHRRTCGLFRGFGCFGFFFGEGQHISNTGALSGEAGVGSPMDIVRGDTL